MDPAERIQIRGILGIHFHRAIDQIEGLFEPDVAVRPEIAEIVGGVGVVGIDLEQFEKGLFGLVESIETLQGGGPGKENVAVVGKSLRASARPPARRPTTAPRLCRTCSPMRTAFGSSLSRSGRSRCQARGSEERILNSASMACAASRASSVEPRLETHQRADPVAPILLLSKGLAEQPHVLLTRLHRDRRSAPTTPGRQEGCRPRARSAPRSPHT